MEEMSIKELIESIKEGLLLAEQEDYDYRILTNVLSNVDDLGRNIKSMRDITENEVFSCDSTGRKEIINSLNIKRIRNNIHRYTRTASKPHGDRDFSYKCDWANCMCNSLFHKS